MKTRYMTTIIILLLVGLSTAQIQTDWAADPFEEMRGEYFADQPSIEDSPITHEPEINAHNSTLTLCFEYSNESLIVIPFDDANLVNVSLQINGTEVAKYPADIILKVVRREMKDIIERMGAS